MSHNAMTRDDKQVQSAQEISLFDLENGRSLTNIVPPVFKEAMHNALEKCPELFSMDERTLWKELRERKQMPLPTDNRLKAAFWFEYNRAQNDISDMNLTGVHGGICTKEFFYKNYITNAHKMAWLLCPPTSYQVIMQEALTFGIDQLREILEEPTFVNGKFNASLANLKLKIVAMIDLRLKGGIVQKNLNLNVSTGDSSIAQLAQVNSMEELEKRMKELEKRERKALNLPVEKKEEKVIDGADIIEAEILSHD